jgi:hypothetical protein
MQVLMFLTKIFFSSFYVFFRFSLVKSVWHILFLFQECSSGDCQLNDAQLLVKAVETEMKNDPGLNVKFGIDGEGALQYLFFQTSVMQ